MCIEDIRLGRMAKGKATHKLTAVDEVVTIDPSPWRIALIIYADANGYQTVDTPTVEANGYGYSMPAQGHPLNINIRDHGELVTKQWQVKSKQIGMVFYVETFLYET